MYKNEDEKLIDILLGEAVMVLLKEDAAISNAALIKQLHAMAAAESDAARQLTFRRAINEVRNYSAPNRDGFSQEIRDSDNVMHLFTNEESQDGSKKH
ncbi:hypothetical protein [Pantoea sp. BAV 3049]|uniref:hypothetical protein n=1 Tax=Pantoea sp. BAV 3049 TaxID=2654188 RepID=UPI00131AAFC2|nr:hypothetical protein [Pantoea sp. BAV 3049]